MFDGTEHAQDEVVVFGPTAVSIAEAFENFSSNTEGRVCDWTFDPGFPGDVFGALNSIQPGLITQTPSPHTLRFSRK